MGDAEEFHFPPDVGTYVLHPCLVHAVGGIQHVTQGSAGGGGTSRISQRTSRDRQDSAEKSAGAVRSSGSRALPEPDPAEVRSLAGAKAADYAVGDVLEGRFKILGLLGQGGFSRVYRVHDDVEDEERALKIFDIAAGHEAVRRA